MFKQTFICPFCFEERKISELQFRCVNRRCKDVDDIELTKYENVEAIPIKSDYFGKKQEDFQIQVHARSVEVHLIKLFALHVTMHYRNLQFWVRILSFLSLVLVILVRAILLE